MSKFSTLVSHQNARVGQFDVQTTSQVNQTFKTPFMFPVASLMTGTTPRGGGIWKYILQANRRFGLLRQNIPLLTQVLQFLDYDIKPRGVTRWRDSSIRGMYNGDETLDLNYTAPLFLDSGGFKLMWRTGLSLDAYGITLDEGHEAENILRFQLDLGGDIIASLDYPLPPNLSPAEMQERMIRSRRNAVEAAKLLQSYTAASRPKPFLYLAVHGLTPEAISQYITQLFQDLDAEGLLSQAMGIAIGSLVPLRSSGKAGEIMKIVMAATRAIPERYRESTPVHVFGATGLLVPFLAFCGVDTSDSSTYGQEARALGYIDPATRSARPILEMRQKDINCSCEVCKELNLEELQENLVIQTNHQPLPNGHYKSKYYADIAFHNLFLDFDIVRTTQAAIESEQLDQYLIDLAKKYRRLERPLQAIAEYDPRIKTTFSRTVHSVSKVDAKSEISTQIYKTLKFSPDDFNITANGYQPLPQGTRKILLLIPCSAEKPYSASDTHRFLSVRLTEALGDWRSHIHKVTLSGLFGPVPVEYENREIILNYDFRLTPENVDQIELCSERLNLYLSKYESSYTHCVAYVTSKAYRRVFKRTAEKFPNLIILPEKPKTQRITEFFRNSNVSELIQLLRSFVP